MKKTSLVEFLVRRSSVGDKACFQKTETERETTTKEIAQEINTQVASVIGDLRAISGNTSAIYAAHLDEQEHKLMVAINENIIGGLEAMLQSWAVRHMANWKAEQRDWFIKKLFTDFKYALPSAAAKAFHKRSKNFREYAATLVTSIVNGVFPFFTMVEGGSEIANELHSGLGAVVAHTQIMQQPQEEVQEKEDEEVGQ